MCLVGYKLVALYHLGIAIDRSGHRPVEAFRRESSGLVTGVEALHPVCFT